MSSIDTDVYLPILAAEEVARQGIDKGQPIAAAAVDQEKEQGADQSPVKVSISQEAADMLEKLEGETLPAAASDQSRDSKNDSDKHSQNNDQHSAELKDNDPQVEENQQGLTPAEEDLVQRLQARDREVRAHEQSHLAAAGELAVGGINYTYQQGPDGKYYAIGGNVKIDTGSEADPEESKKKAQKIRQTALAGADASPADGAAAAKAAVIERNAEAQQSSAAADSVQSLAEKIRSMYNPQDAEYGVGGRINLQG